MFEVVSAISLDGVIGFRDSNAMPWHLPRDLKHFKEVTSGSTVVMGRNTYESIGKPLPNRRNIVISRDASKVKDKLMAAGVARVYSSLQEAVEKESFFYLIGGGILYETALSYPGYGDHIQGLELTVVNATYPISGLSESDNRVRFPLYGQDVVNGDTVQIGSFTYKKISETDWIEDNGMQIRFVRLERV